MSVKLICESLKHIIDAKDIDLDVSSEYDSIISSIKITY